MATWVTFKDVGASESGKTRRWTVYPINGAAPLGGIAWFGRWRKYAFFPAANTVFEHTCLTDIAEWCVSQTKAQKYGIPQGTPPK